MLTCPESVVIKDDGIFLSEDFRALSPPDTVFDWTPAYDMDWEGSPNPISAPLLPIPFTANELAACMLDGPGWGIQEVLDSRIGYPLDEDALQRFTLRQRKIRDALAEAYQQASEAQLHIGEYDDEKERQAHELIEQHSDANDQANSREGVFERGISNKEATERRARAVASVAHLKKRAQEAKAEADMKWTAWRRAMVHQLLGDQELQHVHVAQKKQATQNEQLKKQEALYEAAVTRLEQANKARERREALLTAPEKLGGLAELEALETAVSSARKEVEAAQHAICVMRGDYLDVTPQSHSATEEQMTDFAIGFYTTRLNLEYWYGMNSVLPLEAAKLLSNENPQGSSAHACSTEVQMLARVFEDHSAVHPARRTLLDWVHVAQVRKAKHDTTVAETVLAIAGASGVEIEVQPAPSKNPVADTSSEPDDLQHGCPNSSFDEHSLTTALRPRAKRRDLLVPLIERAQREVDAHDDASAVFALIRSWAKQKSPPAPLIGVTDGGGIQWLNHADEGKELTLSSLRSRITRAKVRS